MARSAYNLWMVSVFSEDLSRVVTKFFEYNNYKTVALSTVESSAASLFVTDFSPKASSKLTSTTIIRVNVSCYSSPSVYGIANVSKIADGYPALLGSFQVDQSDYEQQITEGISKLLCSFGVWEISLITLLQMDEIRRVMLSYLVPRDLAVLSCVNKSLKNIASKRDVDQTFWKKHLKKDFGMTAEPYTHRKTYYDEANSRMKKKLEEQRDRHQSRSLLIDDRHTRPRGPDPNPFLPQPAHPMRPFQPDPLYPDGPFFPDPYGGIRNPAPWDPNNGEMMPSRAPRNIGPRQLGGGSNPFNQFGSNDYI